MAGPERESTAGVARRGSRVGVTIGSTVSGGAIIAAIHGNDVFAVVLFCLGQLWIAVDLVPRQRRRGRYTRLYEDIARRALERPENEDLRTLLMDVASTHPDELGHRMRPRARLGQIRNARQGQRAREPKS